MGAVGSIVFDPGPFSHPVGVTADDTLSNPPSVRPVPRRLTSLLVLPLIPRQRATNYLWKRCLKGVRLVWSVFVPLFGQAASLSNWFSRICFLTPVKITYLPLTLLLSLISRPASR